MSWSLRFDHAVVLVSDLDGAVADFTKLGFTVTPGGTHTSGRTRNALIPFSDGSYIELLAFTRGFLVRVLPLLAYLPTGQARHGLDERLRSRRRMGEGLIDYALLPRSLEADLERIVREGIRAEGPLPGGRTRMDGEQVAWRLALPAPRELPFLCSDTTDRSLRVPSGDAAVHPNGITGIAGITIAVESVEASSARYRALLGVQPEPITGARVGDGRGRIFSIDGAEIIVASAGPSHHPLRQHVRRRGEGPFELHLRVGENQPLPTFREELAHGARLNVTRRSLARH